MTTGTSMRAVRSKDCWTSFYKRRILLDPGMHHQTKKAVSNDRKSSQPAPRSQGRRSNQGQMWSRPAERRSRAHSLLFQTPRRLRRGSQSCHLWIRHLRTRRSAA